MTQEAVLIAALSGRALAASARRAGYIPLVVDAFGDADARSAAGAFQCLPATQRAGFRAKPLIAALEALARAALSPPIGLVLGSGFEDTPRLISALARRFTLLGNDAGSVARAKDPASFFPLLAKLGIAHPETRLAPAEREPGWVSKRIGGSGGAHVVECALGVPVKGRYVQRRLDGTPVSLLAIARAAKLLPVGFSRQWTVGSGPRPYRYGGAAGPAELGPLVEGQMRTAAAGVGEALGLVGLVSFDFIVNGGGAYLLEVNPRPSATLDIFDDAVGALFMAHIAACRGETGPPLKASADARASGVLYAGADPVTVHSVSWPDWAADRPLTGTRIPRYRPLATVHAAGETATAAEYNCRARLDELARMVYGRAADTERNNAKILRPCPERVGACGQAR